MVTDAYNTITANRSGNKNDMAEGNEKLENLLNLALRATEEERAASPELSVGYESTDRTWEVIVKYTGSAEVLDTILKQAMQDESGRIAVWNLSNEYAILTIPEALVERVASLPEIEYMEKPKRLFFAVSNGKRASCMDALQTGGFAGSDHRSSLTGRGVLVGIIDSGIDYSHPDFRNSDGTTRIRAILDQTIEKEYDSDTINLALAQPTEQERYAICPSRDNSGHGTHVAGIAAGNGRASDGRYRGVAYESELLIVKLGNPKQDGFPRTSELMTAVDYCVKKALELSMPLALNISFGNNYGSHSGTSLLETFLDDMSQKGRTSIVVGTGNEGAGGGHAAGFLTEGKREDISFVLGAYETNWNLQIWKNYADEVAFQLIAPGGESHSIKAKPGIARFSIEETEILLYYGEPVPYSPYQEIYLDFLPKQAYLTDGIWTIRLLPQRIVRGNYDMWMPSVGSLNEDTAFLRPSAETTLTIPSTASSVITVGAYDSMRNQTVSFSGRGYTRETNQIKPDLAAPGVDITSCAVNGGYTVRTGTSMATPFVTGAAALLMQWGIVDGNDRYLYGEKLKAYLQKGAKKLPGISTYPNPQIGYGVLCVRDSIML
jgi:subtilisin family serine protease